MRVSRIYTEQTLEPGAACDLRGAAAAHILQVLRLRPGDPLTLFNGHGGEFAARLVTLGRERVTCGVGAFDAIERESPLHIILLQGIARGDRMDAIVQKSTELGIARLIPVAARRSVVRLAADTSERKRAHWRGIAIAACEQCGRNRIPQIDAPLAPERACAAMQGASNKILLDPLARTSLPQFLANAKLTDPVVIYIGPEGGLTDEEHGLAARAGFRSCSLGPRVLRTETASLAALSVVHAVCGDFRSSEL